MSFEDLAQSLRVLLEADIRAHRQELLFIDRAEAVGNIETGLNAVVNSFHSLYDAINKELGHHPINWYQEPELATILAIRNARHHNKANRIRQLYNYHVQSNPNPQDMKQYVVIDFPTGEEDADTFEVFLSWSDLESYLALPTDESRLNAKTVSAINSYFNAIKMSTYAVLYGVPASQVFFNVIPLVVNAASKIVPIIKPFINATSLEAETYITLFDGMKPASIHEHLIHLISVALPE